MPKIAVHLHLYYLEQLDDILQRLSYLDGCKYDLFVTMSELNPQAHKKILKFNPQATIWQTPNFGYDIGPFIDFLHKIKLHFHCHLKHLLYHILAILYQLVQLHLYFLILLNIQ